MTEPTSSRTTVGRVVQVLGSLVLIVACLYWAQKVLIPLALAILLTFILSPLVTRLHRRGLPHGVAVALVVSVVFVGLVGLGWGITEQLRRLLVEVPQHRNEIATKLLQLKGTGTGPVADFIDMVRDINEKVLGTDNALAEQPMPVVVVNEKVPGLNFALGVAGPVLEVLLSGAFMAILVVFMLAKQEDLRNRFFRAVGQGQLAATTRAVDEAAQRISRFLVTQLLINVGFGAVWAVALSVMPGGPSGLGVPYAFLWGCLAAALRFVPYIGTWVALCFPLLLSIALSPVEHAWFQPLLLAGTFFVLEMVTGNVLEPLLFGRHAGVSPIAILIAAVFWGWLWGPIGLVLSTPLTVCLVVLGKYVPQLHLFAVFLGDEAPLKTEIGCYQRLLAGDEDEATDLVEDYVAKHELETVYDEVLLPALVLARRDAERGNLGQKGERFVLEVTRRIVDDLLGEELDDSSPSGANGKAMVLGCPARDESDEVALHMLAQLLRADNCPMEVLSAKALTSEVIARAQEEKPSVVCIASLPPGGVAQASYLCKRLRSKFPDLKIIVARLGADRENIERVRERLKEAGANQVVTTLLAARQEVLPLVRLGEGSAPPKESAALSGAQR